jgi:hypothetical protein
VLTIVKLLELCWRDVTNSALKPTSVPPLHQLARGQLHLLEQRVATEGARAAYVARPSGRLLRKTRRRRAAAVTLRQRKACAGGEAGDRFAPGRLYRVSASLPEGCSKTPGSGCILR